MDASRRHSMSRHTRAIALAIAVVTGCAIAAPAAALASENIDIVNLNTISLFVNTKKIAFSAVRFEGNPADPVRVTATEEAEGRSVTIRDVTTAAGGFVALAPCEKTEAQTAVCPMQDAEGHAVSLVEVRGAVEGNQAVTIDTPTLLALAQTGSGSDTLSIPHATPDRFQPFAGIIDPGPGNDTETGGVGKDEFIGSQGTDTIFAFNEPAKEDRVQCDARADTAHVDSLDRVEGECRIIRGP
jgi:hypothetical protein